MSDTWRHKVLNTAFGHRRRSEVMSAGGTCDDHQVGVADKFSMITS